VESVGVDALGQIRATGTLASSIAGGRHLAIRFERRRVDDRIELVVSVCRVAGNAFGCTRCSEVGSAEQSWLAGTSGWRRCAQAGKESYAAAGSNLARLGLEAEVWWPNVVDASVRQWRIRHMENAVLTDAAKRDQPMPRFAATGLESLRPDTPSP